MLTTPDATKGSFSSNFQSSEMNSVNMAETYGKSRKSVILNVIKSSSEH